MILCIWRLHRLHRIKYIQIEFQIALDKVSCMWDYVSLRFISDTRRYHRKFKKRANETFFNTRRSSLSPLSIFLSLSKKINSAVHKENSTGKKKEHQTEIERTKSTNQVNQRNALLRVVLITCQIKCIYSGTQVVEWYTESKIAQALHASEFDGVESIRSVWSTQEGGDSKPKSEIFIYFTRCVND